MEFSISFMAPALPGDTLHFRWEVTGVVWKETLNGEIVSLGGSICDAADTTLLRATGRVLVAASL